MWSRSCALTFLGAVGCAVTPADTTNDVIAGRVHPINAPLATTATTTSAARPLDFTASGGYTYVAAVDAPVNPATGDLLQATNFAFDATHAYVTYNMKGDAVEGALDIVDLSVPAAPTLVGSLLFPSAEFADIAIAGSVAFLVGADSAGSTLVAVDISDPTAPALVGSLALPSYYATAIAIDNATAYVTSGDTGGVLRVDISNPASPSIYDVTPVANALSVVLTSGNTIALGGGSDAELYSIVGGVATSIGVVDSAPFVSPARMVFANGKMVTNGTHSGLSVIDVAADGSSANVAFHADLDGTGNGLDIAGSLAILAQGEVGTLLYDVTSPEAPARLGSFAFPDERGSSNEVRIGSSGGAQYAFLSDGLGGFRIIQIASTVAPTCSNQWWQPRPPGDWWMSPATDDAATSGTWAPVEAETTSLCLVEQFTPDAADAACSPIQVKRAIAIGPQPNEGQICPVTCPAGMVIENAHTRYGEASPLNADGIYTCTDTTQPDSHEIACDAMSDACDGQTLSCNVLYQNSFCGDPWYECIKSGRTKWQCVPE